MGRPRKPTVLKIVAGTDRAYKKVPNEPAPAHVEGLPDPPQHLSTEAASCWNRMSAILQGMAVLTTADLFALERMCMTYAELRALDFQIEALAATTYETSSERSGMMRRSHPEVAQRADAERRFLQWLNQFGLTPAARTKISIGARDSSDPFGKYFGQ